MNRHRIERGQNLRRELSRWRHDECTCFPTRLADEMVQNREDERGGLAAPRHRAGQDVTPFERGWNCFSLNWGWSLETQLFEAFVEAGVEL